ncbi:MAG: flavodoxin family protein [Actinomycetota bacterium]|nr:flavodoxin family protein [Actinomycetota bacterium]
MIGLACSPRRGGNTELMLDCALRGALEAGEETEKIIISELNLNPCKACNACFKTGRCAQKDDMQDLYPLLLSGDAVILAAPIFSMNLAAQAKILIDRLQCLWATKFVLKRHTVSDDKRESRKGLWISTAGLPRDDVFEPAMVTVKYFFSMLEIGHWERITQAGVDAKGAIKNYPETLERSRKLGAYLVEDCQG